MPFSFLGFLDYGAFVQMQGFHKHGLVHKSQASRHFTEKISDVVEVGDSVWVWIRENKEHARNLRHISVSLTPVIN